MPLIIDIDIDNTNAYPNNIAFTIKYATLYIPVVILSAKYNQKYQNFLERFERSVYWNEYKTKIENRDTTNKHRYFLEFSQILYVLTDCYNRRQGKKV